MSDGAPRDSAVFGGLDAFDDHAVDSDAMDRMLLNLAAASDPADWQLDALAPDFYSAPNAYPSLSLQYIDTQVPAQTAAPANHSSVSLPPLPCAAQDSADAAAAGVALSMPNGDAGSGSGSASGDPPAMPHLSPSSDNEVQVNLDGRPASKSPPHLGAALHAVRIEQSAPQPKNTATNSLSPPGPATSRKRPPSSAPSARSPHLAKSPATSGSSAKQRVPTALCSLCGKSISTNGANFRRHEQACRRQRGERVSSARPPSSPLVTTSPLNPSQLHMGGSATATRELQPVVQPEAVAVAAPAVVAGSSALPIGLTRRDSDLLNVVKRLEKSIGTLDVSARLCLRDALVSLSNKAANPHVPPTPEQEAMNRAAEYLVLRMLFLSGQQVMHTAPGTAGNAYTESAHLASTSVQGAASRSTQTSRDIAMGSARTAGQGDDGTVAASTGTGGVTLGRQESSMGDSPLRSSAKTEDRIIDGS